MKEELKSLIKEKYKNEAACAAELEWPRQKLNKITNGKKEPDLRELMELANVLDTPLQLLADIFLSYWSPNGQHKSA